MGRHHIRFTFRCKLRRAVSGNGGNKTVNQDRHAHHGSAQIAAEHARDIQASHLGKHVQNVVLIRLIHLDSPANDFHFMLQSGAGKSRTTACDFRHVFVQQHCRHGGTGRGVADPHFSGDDHAVARLIEIFHHLDSGLNGLNGLFPAHGRFLDHIGSAVTDYPVPDPGMLSVHEHTDIYRNNLDAHLPGHDTDRGFAIAHIFQHLGCDLASGLADALGYHAVVRAHDDDHRFQSRDFTELRGSVDACQLGYHFFQPSHAP